MKKILLPLLLIMGLMQTNAQTNLSITCPPNFQDTVMNACSKLITVPNPSYNTSDKTSTITWTMTGLTVAASPDTGQNFVGTRRFNTGGTLIKYTIRKNNDSATCSFGFALREFVRPTITCPGSITGYTTGQACSRAMPIPNPVISDNCKIFLLSWKMIGATNDSSSTQGIYVVGFRAFNRGITNVTYLVTDASGNTAKCTFKVTILDTLKPILKCPGNITAYANDSCRKKVSIPNPVYSDPCGVALLKWKATGATNAASPLTGINVVGAKSFNIGITTIIYTAKDSAGNISTCSFTVTIRDTSRPVIRNCPDSIVTSVSADCSKNIAVPALTFFDNCGAQLKWTMSGATVASGTGQIGMASFNIGITLVVYTVTDASGNKATCMFKVILRDLLKPAIQCPSSISDTIKTNACSKAITIPNPVFSDNCSKGISVYWKTGGATVAASPTTGLNFIGTTTFNVGTTNCVYIVRDGAGNTTSCSFTVTVVELKSPVIACPADRVIDSVVKCSRSVTVNPPTVSDNCGVVRLTWKMTGATVMSSPTTGINFVGTKTFNRGTTLITYTARDASGNAATCSHKVILTGPEPCQQTFAKEYIGAMQENEPVRFRLLNNPAHQYFTLKLETTSNVATEVIIYSADGRKIEQLRGKAGQIITFGANYTKGSYLVEVRQGLERKTLTAIKL